MRLTRIEHETDPDGSLDLKGFNFKELPYRVDLGRVRFQGLNLWSSHFEDVSLKDARFEGCALGLCTFTAAAVYNALRLDLTGAGDTEGASWAAYRQRQLERRDVYARGQRLRFLGSLLLDGLWGYGEKPARLFVFSLAFCGLCALGYFFTGLTLGGQCVTDPLEHLVQCVYFSFVTFTTLGYGDMSPCTITGRMQAVVQAFSGVFIMGLFVSANVRKLSGG